MKKNEVYNVNIVKQFVDDCFALSICGKHSYEQSREINRVLSISGYTLNSLCDYIGVHGEGCKEFDKNVYNVMRDFFEDLSRLDIYHEMCKRIIELNKGDKKFLSMVKRYHIWNHELIKVDE